MGYRCIGVKELTVELVQGLAFLLSAVTRAGGPRPAARTSADPSGENAFYLSASLSKASEARKGHATDAARVDSAPWSRQVGFSLLSRDLNASWGSCPARKWWHPLAVGAAGMPNALVRGTLGDPATDGFLQTGSGSCALTRDLLRRTVSKILAE